MIYKTYLLNSDRNEALIDVIFIIDFAKGMGSKNILGYLQSVEDT